MYRTSALPLREWVRYYALTLRRAGSSKVNIDALCPVAIRLYFSGLFIQHTNDPAKAGSFTGNSVAAGQAWRSSDFDSGCDTKPIRGFQIPLDDGLNTLHPV